MSVWTETPTLTGRHVTLRPFVEADLPALVEVAREGDLWDIFYANVSMMKVPERWLAAALKERDVGRALLFAPVVEPGQIARTVWLPEGARWVSYWSGETFDGGQHVTLPAPWDQPVVLVREGSVVPLNVAEQHFARPAERRAFIVVPQEGTGVTTAECIDDDGESAGLIECSGISDYLPCLGLAAPARVIATKNIDCLRRQPNMSDDWDTAIDQESDGLCHGFAAFKLNASAARVLEQS